MKAHYVKTEPKQHECHACGSINTTTTYDSAAQTATLECKACGAERAWPFADLDCEAPPWIGLVGEPSSGQTRICPRCNSGPVAPVATGRIVMMHCMRCGNHWDMCPVKGCCSPMEDRDGVKHCTGCDYYVGSDMQYEEEIDYRDYELCFF